MKYLFISAMLCLASVNVWAQLEPRITHFTNSRVLFNPATAGQYETTILGAIMRQQWMGFEGAPKTALASYQTNSLAGRLGLGANLMYHEIGIHKRSHVDLAYAYRATGILNGVLSFGLQTSFRHVQQDWTDKRLIGTQSLVLDAGIPGTIRSRIFANFGAGVYMEAEKYYLGLSVPRFMDQGVQYDLEKTERREPTHIYFLSGYTHDINTRIRMSYHLQANYVPSQPLDLDLNATLHFNDRIQTGITVRPGGDEKTIGESINMMVGIQATEKLNISAGYDIGLSSLRRYNTGSIELYIGYALHKPSGVFGNFMRLEHSKPESN